MKEEKHMMLMMLRPTEMLHTYTKRWRGKNHLAQCVNIVIFHSQLPQLCSCFTQTCIHHLAHCWTKFCCVCMCVCLYLHIHYPIEILHCELSHQWHIPRQWQNAFLFRIFVQPLLLLLLHFFIRCIELFAIEDLPSFARSLSLSQFLILVRFFHYVSAIL